MNQAFKNFAIDLLDDKCGINRQAWKTLVEMLYDYEYEDILDAISIIRNDTYKRYYLKTEVAQELRKANS